jgi:hypothetical protein
MKQLAKLILSSCMAATPAAFSAEALQPIRDIVLDDHTVYAVPVSGTRVTTVSFPGPISAIDAALITTDAKTTGLFQIAHTKGTSYFSVRALAKDAATNLNVRWNAKTYVIELRESAHPWYSVNLQPRDIGKSATSRPLTSARLLGLLDKAKAYRLLKQHLPEAVADVDFRDGSKEPCVTDCGNYEVRVNEAFRFNAEDTLVFHLTLENKTAKPIEFLPERVEVKAGSRDYFPSVTQLSGVIGPKTTTDGYLAITGSPEGERNGLSMKNDFTFVLDRTSSDTELPADELPKAIKEGGK